MSPSVKMWLYDGFTFLDKTMKLLFNVLTLLLRIDLFVDFSVFMGLVNSKKNIEYRINHYWLVGLKLFSYQTQNDLFTNL